MSCRCSVLLLLLCGLLAGISARALADDAGGAGYRLGQDDIVTITVLHHPEFSGDFLIPPDGIIDCPAIGRISASGMTLDALRETVAQRLAARLRQPQVTVALRAPRPRRIFVLGAVNAPGAYDAALIGGISGALAAAGGLRAAATETVLKLWHAETGGQEQFDLAVLPLSALSAAPMHAGDVLVVEATEKFSVYVNGAVKLPGLYEVRAGAGVNEAMAQAGGLTIPQGEATITLLRGTDRIPLPDLSGTDLPDAITTLRRGDVIAVESRRNVAVMVTGKVRTPGLQWVMPGEGIVQAVTLAGGALEDADLSQVKIMRASGATTVADITSVFLDGTSTVSIPVQSGDLVIVPELVKSFTVLGYVNAPGSYPVKPGKPLRVTEAIAIAKGPVNRDARLGRVMVLQPGPDGKPVATAVSISTYLKTGDLRQNPLIKPEAIIYVPESNTFDWNKAVEVLSIASMIRTISGQ